MSFLSRLFGNKAPDPNEIMRPLYLAVIAKGREPHWYEDGAVPDSMDGRFAMISPILALVLLRMEALPELGQPAAWLTEIFVDDMDAQMREAGLGDVVIAKDMGKVMGVLGGRIGAYRSALSSPLSSPLGSAVSGGLLGGGDSLLSEAVDRNIYGGDNSDITAKQHTTRHFGDVWAMLQSRDASALLAGNI